MQLPPFALSISILCALSAPLILVTSRAAGTAATPGLRFRIAIAIAFSSWLIIVGVGVALGARPALSDIAAGIAVLTAATLLTFIAWSLVVWGFTINMMLCIARADEPLDRRRWLQAYAGPEGTAAITRDRAAVLLRAGLAVREENDYVVTPRGRTVARLTRVLRSAFGVSR